MNRLFGSGTELKLDIQGLQKTLIQNMLQVHIASVDKRLESCERCPLICDNPSGFKAEPAIDPTEENRLQNYPILPKGTKLPYYEGLQRRLRENRLLEAIRDTGEAEEEKAETAETTTTYPETAQRRLDWEDEEGDGEGDDQRGYSGELEQARQDNRQIRLELRNLQGDLSGTTGNLAKERGRTSVPSRRRIENAP